MTLRKDDGIRIRAVPSDLGSAQSPLIRARDAGNIDVARLYRERPLKPIYDEICKRRYPREAVAAAIKAQALARGARSPALFANIEKLKESQTCTIVTGQQVGVFGGPAYSLYKALSAIRLAHTTSHQGLHAVPVFWLASYDHDFLEISRLSVVNGRPGSTRFDLPIRSERAPVGSLRIGTQITELMESFGESLRASHAPFAEQAFDLLKEVYTPEETFAGAFARLLGNLTDRYGLLILDPHVREVAVHLREIVAQELWGTPSSHSALAATAAEISRLGFRPRIDSSPEELNVFFVNDRGARVRLCRGNGGSFIAEGMPSGLSESEARTLLEEAPERFSPSALLRPAFESTVLPTLASIAGPAESEYYAQVAGVYDWAKIPFPHVASRASLTLIGQSEYSRFAQKTGRAINTVLRAKQPLRALAWASLPEEVANAYQALEALALILDHGNSENKEMLFNHLRAGLERAQNAVTVAGFERCKRGLDYSIPRIEHWLSEPDSETHRTRREIGRLVEQVLKAGRRLNPEGVATIHRLLPTNIPQERVLSLGQLLAEFGPDIAEVLLPFTEPEYPARQLLVLPEPSELNSSTTPGASSFVIDSLNRSRAELITLYRSLSPKTHHPPRKAARPRRIGVLALSGFGGSGNVARTCAQGYAESGNPCTLFSSPESSWSDTQLLGVRVVTVSVPAIPTEPQSRWIEVLARELAASIELAPLDVLHIHYAAGLLEAAVQAADILKRKNIDLKLIATLHGTDVTHFGRDPFHGPKITKALSRCSALTTVSEVLSRQAREIFGLSQAPVIIPNSVDSALWNPEQWSDLRSKITSDGEILLCHLSNLRAVKRPLDVVATLAGLRNKGVPAKLMLIGDGPLLSSLYKSAEELGVTQSILPFGEQEPARLPLLVAASDIMLVTSESESFSLAALEAMACGVPVVGTRCGGLEEILTKLDLDPAITQGLLSPIGDIDKLVEICQSLVQRESIYRSVQRSAIRLPSEAYPRSCQIESYLGTLEKAFQK